MAVTLADLASLPIWLIWEAVPSQRADGSAKIDKPPIDPRTGYKGSKTDPAIRMTRAAAEAAAQKYGLVGARGGLGLLMTTFELDGVLWQLGGLDTDHCYVEGEGRPARWADPVFAILDGHYTETSPSGTGRHHLFVIEADHIPNGVGSDIDYSLGAGGERHGFELYTRAPGYLTFTGRDVQGDLQAISPFTLMRLFNALEAFKPRATKPKANGHFAKSDHDKALDILAHLPNSGDYDDYPKWVGVVAALHAATGGSEAGRRATAAWSKDGGSRTAQEGVDVLYEYFDRVPPRADLGHLVNEARDHGYEPYPRQRKEAKSNSAASPRADVENAADPTTEWSDIDPALVEDARRHIPVFPVRLFPPEWREWTVTTAEGAGAPVDYVALALLASVAGVTGCGVTVQATPSWSEPLILWLALVGAPSTGKSPALDQARQLLDALEAEAKEGDEERRRLYETNVEASKVAADIWREVLAIATKEKTPAPVKPAEACQVGSFVPTQFVVGDTTIESIVDVVKGNPRGVVLWRDELTGWLMNVARYGGGNDRPFWLERWSAASATVNRKNRPPVHIPRLGASIVGGIQPDRLGEIFAEVDDGMAARLLYAYPSRPPYTSLLQRRGGHDDRALGRLRQIGAASGSAENPLVLKLDVGAVKLLDEFCAEHHAEADEYEGLEGGWFGKGRGHVVRLAGVFSLLAWSETDGTVPPPPITANAVHAAAGLWSGYFLPVARAVFARTGTTLADRQVRRIIAWIRRTEASTISLEDVRVHALGRTVDAADATALIARLVRCNALRPAPAAAKGPGKPPIRWEVNPALHAPKSEDAHA